MSEYNELDIKQIRTVMTLAQLQALLDSVYVNVSGDTMTGSLIAPDYTANNLTSQYLVMANSSGKLVDSPFQNNVGYLDIGNGGLQSSSSTPFLFTTAASLAIPYFDFSGNYVINDATINYDGAGTVNFPTLLLSTGDAISALGSNTYTPTLTSVQNISAKKAYACQYLRVGNTVTVSGKLDIDTAAAGATKLGISLPIASNFTTNYDCAGGAFPDSTSTDISGAIIADATNDRAELNYSNTDFNNHSMWIHFTYQIK